MARKKKPSAADLKKMLTPEAYHITQEKGTERPGSSPLLTVKDPGTFKCAVCGAPLFRTETKFESGTGWPSFFAPMDGDAVETKMDASHGAVRTEVVCSELRRAFGPRLRGRPHAHRHALLHERLRARLREGLSGRSVVPPSPIPPPQVGREPLVVPLLFHLPPEGEPSPTLASGASGVGRGALPFAGNPQFA